MRLGLLCLLLAVPMLGQRATAVFLYTSTARPVAGTTLPVEVMAIDANANFLGNVNAVWTTNNAAVAEVKSGQIVTKAPGMVDLAATVLGARGILRLQVLPARVEITPANAKLESGQRVQFKATVLNAQGEEIPSVAIRWEVVGLDGGVNNGISINQTGGGLTGGAVGRYRVKANIDYPNAGNGQFQPVYTVSTSLRVDPKQYYQTNVLLSSQTRVSGFRLTSRSSRLTMNSNGDLAFLASAEGMGTAVLRAKGNTLELAGLSGEVIARPGMVVGDFDDVLINDSGELLAAGAHYGTDNFASGRSLYFLTRPGVARGATLAGLISSGADAINGFTMGRRSYNNSGRYAYVANFSESGTRVGRTGIFVSDGNFDELVLKSTDPLPGLKSPLSFSSEFSIDDQDNLWFAVVDADGKAALCLRLLSEGTVKVLLNPTTGLAGYKPVQIDSLQASPKGTVTFRMRDATQGWAMAVLTTPALTGAKVTPLAGDFRSIFAVNDRGDVVMAGAFGGGSSGLYLIPYSGAARALALLGRPAPDGETYQDFRGAAINAKGDIAYAAKTNMNPQLIVREGGGKDEIIFPQLDLRIADSMRLVAPGFVSNTRGGETKVSLGSSQQGVMELTARGPKLLLTPDFLVPGAPFYADINSVVGQPDGGMLIGTDAGVLRYTPSGAEVVGPGRGNVGSSTQFRAFRMASNRSGSILSFHSLSSGTARLNLTMGGQTRVLGNFGTPGDASLRTAAPGGGYFTSINGIELDEEGTAYVFANTSAGQPGIYTYRAGVWAALAVPNQTLVEVTKLLSISNWDVGADRVFLQASLVGNNRQVIVECSATGCRTLFDLSSDMPRGAPMNGFSMISANRKNDIAFTYNAGSNQDVVVVPSGGQMRLVMGFDKPLAGGEWILQYRALQLRDDGKLLVSVFTSNENIAILEGTPLN